LGAISRYAVQGWVNDLLGPTLLGTLLVNVSGSFALGFLLAYTEDRLLVTSLVRVTIAIGFIGSYTTFSTVMYESLARLESGQFLAFAANLAGSLAFGLLAAYGGLAFGRTL
jgi:fluoride exporter